MCKSNEFSQSKVTGLLVEEALRSRGELNESFEKKPLSKNNKSPSNHNIYSINKESFSNDIKMMHEYIEYKYFKKIMMQNNHFVE